MEATPYEVTIQVKLKAYLHPDELYDNHTADKVIEMLAADILEGWITRNEARINYKQIREIPWHDIDIDDDYNPWERAKEDAAID